MKEKAARPENGWHLRNQTPAGNGGFVAAVPSRVHRDGTGRIVINLKSDCPIFPVDAQQTHHQLKAGIIRPS
jgi:hypothetical protein